MTKVVHELKVLTRYYEALLNGKTFEVRKNDRSFQRGDEIFLREWIPSVGRYTQRELRGRISYVFSNDPALPSAGGLLPGFVVLGLDFDEHE